MVYRYTRACSDVDFFFRDSPKNSPSAGFSAEIIQTFPATYLRTVKKSELIASRPHTATAVDLLGVFFFLSLFFVFFPRRLPETRPRRRRRDRFQTRSVCTYSVPPNERITRVRNATTFRIDKETSRRAIEKSVLNTRRTALRCRRFNHYERIN